MGFFFTIYVLQLQFAASIGNMDVPWPTNFLHFRRALAALFNEARLLALYSEILLDRLPPAFFLLLLVIAVVASMIVLPLGFAVLSAPAAFTITCSLLSIIVLFSPFAIVRNIYPVRLITEPEITAVAVVSSIALVAWMAGCLRAAKSLGNSPKKALVIPAVQSAIGISSAVYCGVAFLRLVLAEKYEHARSDPDDWAMRLEWVAAVVAAGLGASVFLPSLAQVGLLIVYKTARRENTLSFGSCTCCCLYPKTAQRVVLALLVFLVGASLNPTVARIGRFTCQEYFCPAGTMFTPQAERPQGHQFSNDPQYLCDPCVPFNTTDPRCMPEGGMEALCPAMVTNALAADPRFECSMSALALAVILAVIPIIGAVMFSMVAATVYHTVDCLDFHMKRTGNRLPHDEAAFAQFCVGSVGAAQTDREMNSDDEELDEKPDQTALQGSGSGSSLPPTSPGGSASHYAAAPPSPLSPQYPQSPGYPGSPGQYAPQQSGQYQPQYQSQYQPQYQPQGQYQPHQGQYQPQPQFQQQPYSGVSTCNAPATLAPTQQLHQGPPKLSSVLTTVLSVFAETKRLLYRPALAQRTYDRIFKASNPGVRGVYEPFTVSFRYGVAMTYAYSGIAAIIATVTMGPNGLYIKPALLILLHGFAAFGSWKWLPWRDRIDGLSEMVGSAHNSVGAAVALISSLKGSPLPDVVGYVMIAADVVIFGLGFFLGFVGPWLVEKYAKRVAAKEQAENEDLSGGLLQNPSQSVPPDSASSFDAAPLGSLSSPRSSEPMSPGSPRTKSEKGKLAKFFKVRSTEDEHWSDNDEAAQFLARCVDYAAVRVLKLGTVVIFIFLLLVTVAAIVFVVTNGMTMRDSEYAAVTPTTGGVYTSWEAFTATPRYGPNWTIAEASLGGACCMNVSLPLRLVTSAERWVWGQPTGLIHHDFKLVKGVKLAAQWVHPRQFEGDISDVAGDGFALRPFCGRRFLKQPADCVPDFPRMSWAFWSPAAWGPQCLMNSTAFDGLHTTALDFLW